MFLLRKIITCGEDGDVRIWQGFDDVDSVSISVGEKCYCIVQRNDKIYISNDQNEIKKYDLITTEFEAIITTFQLPVTCMCISKDGKKLICGSSDFEIRLVELDSSNYETFEGHNAPILSVCIDPMEKYFISSSCDGTVKFWSIKQRSCVKTLQDNHEKSNDFSNSKVSARVSWHKDSHLIVVPSKSDIHFYERESWQMKFKIAVQEGQASLTALSGDGKNVLFTNTESSIYIYSIITKQMLFKYAYNKKLRITSIAWNPSIEQEVLFCDIKGQLGFVKVTLSNETKDSSDDMKMDELMDLLNADEDSNSKSSDISRSPNAKKRKRLEEDSDDASISLDKLRETTYKEVKSKLSALDENTNDDDIYMDLMSKKADKEESVQLTKVVQVKVDFIKDPFQPSSTPFEDNDECILRWNAVGIITASDRNDEKSIYVEFHNASFHHSIHINNFENYKIGDLSKKALVLASCEEENSKINCILLDPWDSSNKEWLLNMPKHEFIKCISVSNTLCACVTNHRFLRIFTLNGVQCEIITLPALQVLSMASYENSIFIAYFVNQSVNSNEQIVGYSLIQHDDLKKSENGYLTLSHSAQLEWLGFSDEGSPYYYDSNGFLYTKHSDQWLVASNLRSNIKHKSDNYWLVGISERTQSIKAILCKSSRYPQKLLPKPVLSVIPFEVPLCESNSEKSKLEQDYWKTKLLGSNLKNFLDSTNFESNLEMDEDEIDEINDKLSIQIKETQMKMFVLACKSNKEQRAYEIAQMMDTLTLKLSIKYATKARHLQLAQHLNNLAEQKAIEELAKSRRTTSARNSRDDDNADDIVIEKTNYTPKSSAITKPSTDDCDIVQVDEAPSNTNSEINITSTNDTTVATPSMPLTNTRFNPFKQNSQSAKLREATTPSILSEIEDKMVRNQQSKEEKKKDTWKPTPTRKLTKSKVSSGTPNANPKLDSFFGAKNKKSALENDESLVDENQNNDF